MSTLTLMALHVPSISIGASSLSSACHMCNFVTIGLSLAVVHKEYRNYITGLNCTLDVSTEATAEGVKAKSIAHNF